MSSSDLYVDGYPHGTPQGYDDGCKGGACPAGVAYGLSCKIAKQKSRGDFQYQKLVKAGTSIPAIAEALGLIGSETAATPLKKPTPKPPKKFGVSITEAAAALEKAATAGMVNLAAVPTPTPPKPERYLPVEGTEQGKQLLEETAKAIAKQELTNAGVDGAEVDAAAEAAVELATTPASAPKTPALAPKPSEIRAWARTKGYDVGAKGKIPQHIVDRYWEATGRLNPEPATAPAVEASEACLICGKTGAATFECEHPDAHIPLATAEQDANGEPYADQPEISDVSIELKVTVPETMTNGEQYAQALAEAAKPERPEWGAVAAHIDLEDARRWAVRFEQEYAHIEEKLAASETAFEELSAQADKLLADVEREQAEALRIAGDYVDEFGKNLIHKAHLEDLRERLANEQKLRRVAEQATALALTKWGEERAANEASHALIVGQAHTINTLTDCLAAPRWVLGADVDPEAFDVSASRIMHVPEPSYYPSSVDIPDGNTGADGVVYGVDKDSDTLPVTKKPRLWHRR